MSAVREKNVTLIEGSGGGHIAIKTTADSIGFYSDDFGTLLTTGLVTDDGRTVSQRRRADLHAMLDAWLDKTWGEDDAQ